MFSNWSTKKDLTEDQINVFKELYLKQQAQNITQVMQNHTSNTVTGIDISNYGANNSKLQDEIIEDLD